MFALEEALKKCDKKELIEGTIRYKDFIPNSTKEFGEKNVSNKNYNLMRSLEGVITSGEIKSSNHDYKNYVLLNKYIFNDIDAETISIEDCDIDALIELKLMVSSESEYTERLDKLMFRIYFEKGKYELRGMIQEIFEKYEWAFIKEKYKSNEKTLEFQPENNGYNKKFGISNIENNFEKDNDKIHDVSVSQENKKENWISQKFGG